MPICLHAITPADAQIEEASPEPVRPRLSGMLAVVGSDATRVSFREISAVISHRPTFAPVDVTVEAIARHRAIVDAAFKRAAVVPAPMGVVFRDPDVLMRWMELHYVSLTGALEFLDDRSVARVHIVRADGKNDDLDPDSDLSSQAAEAARALRRRAVASVPLRPERSATADVELGAAFLVETASWKQFLIAVAEQQDAHHLLRFETSGPWAPYDFVRMQFGS